MKKLKCARFIGNKKRSSLGMYKKWLEKHPDPKIIKTRTVMPNSYGGLSTWIIYVEEEE